MAKNTKKQPSTSGVVDNGENTQDPQKNNALESVVDVPKAEDEQPQVEVTEPIIDETIVEIDEVTTNETEYEEQLRLAKELNLTVRTDPNTGKPVLPSTPAMRAAAAAAARKPLAVNTHMDIDEYVLKTFGEQAAENPNIKLVVSKLTNYVKKMSPTASIDEITGGEQQAELANMYDVVLSLKPELSQVGLEIIVAVVKQNIRGAFGQTTALRFANTMPVNNERAIRFQLLTTLFMSMATGTTKKDLAKTINIRQLLEYITDRNAKANISEFIN